MKAILCYSRLIACCGLYCGACGAFLKGKCPGCAENKKASWCKVRACCAEKGYAGCADCSHVKDSAECGKLNNLIAKIFSFIFRSDRNACIRRIREIGRDKYASEMASQKQHSIKRN